MTGIKEVSSQPALVENNAQPVQASRITAPRVSAAAATVFTAGAATAATATFAFGALSVLTGGILTAVAALLATIAIGVGIATSRKSEGKKLEESAVSTIELATVAQPAQTTEEIEKPGSEMAEGPEVVETTERKPATSLEQARQYAEQGLARAKKLAQSGANWVNNHKAETATAVAAAVVAGYVGTRAGQSFGKVRSHAFNSYGGELVEKTGLLKDLRSTAHLTRLAIRNDVLSTAASVAAVPAAVVASTRAAANYVAAVPANVVASARYAKNYVAASAQAFNNVRGIDGNIGPKVQLMQTVRDNILAAPAVPTTARPGYFAATLQAAKNVMGIDGKIGPKVQLAKEIRNNLMNPAVAAPAPVVLASATPAKGYLAAISSVASKLMRRVLTA